MNFSQKNKPATQSTIFSRESRKKILSEDSPFAVKESYNTIRTNLLFYNAELEQCPIYVFSSALPGEGKTTTAINTAITFAESGKRTLLIDGDMRNPSIHKYFMCQKSPGFSEYLAGIETKVQFIDTAHGSLKIIPSGDIPPNPASLLLNAKLDEFLSLCKKNFDCIIIDAPPALMVTDTAILSSKATGCIMIVKVGSSDAQSIAKSIESVNQAKGNVIGFILNDAEGKSELYSKKKGYYKSYDYKYGYGRPTKKN